MHFFIDLLLLVVPDNSFGKGKMKYSIDCSDGNRLKIYNQSLVQCKWPIIEYNQNQFLETLKWSIALLNFPLLSYIITFYNSTDTQEISLLRSTCI